MYRDYIIAGLRVRMETFGRTLIQAEPYIADSGTDADIIIHSYPQALLEQQPHLTLDTCEYLCTGGSFYGQLLNYDGLLLHSSAVISDGFAYLFSAPSGTGKSTHTSFWLDLLTPERAKILNDDKPALRRENGVWYAYGTPWSGKTAQNINMRVKLGGICVLARGETNSIMPYSGSQAVFSLLEQTVRPRSGEGRLRLLGLLDRIFDEVPVWHMCCTPTLDAAKMSYEVMSGEAMRRFGNGEQ